MAFSAGGALSGAASGAAAGASFGPWGAAIGGLAGGALGAFSGSGSKGQSGHSADYWNTFNYEAQKEFAQQGIRWRVADAKAAGLHPLAALGSMGASYSPSAFVGGSGYDTQYDIPGAIGSLGQSFDRALSAKETQEERMKAQARQDEMYNLQLENMGLQNQSLRADIALQQARASQTAIATQQQVPPMPSLRVRSDGAVIPGQANSTTSSLFSLQPAEITYNQPGYPGTTAGSIPELTFARTADGGYAPVPSQDVKNSIEDNYIAETTWQLRNLLPGVFNDADFAPPDDYLPPGKEWSFHIGNGAWYPVPAGTTRLGRLARSSAGWLSFPHALARSIFSK